MSSTVSYISTSGSFTITRFIGTTVILEGQFHGKCNKASIEWWSKWRIIYFSNGFGVVIFSSTCTYSLIGIGFGWISFKLMIGGAGRGRDEIKPWNHFELIIGCAKRWLFLLLRDQDQMLWLYYLRYLLERFFWRVRFEYRWGSNWWGRKFRFRLLWLQ